MLRRGEVELAIARAHLNVPALRDLDRYEEYARRAVASGTRLGPLGRSLVVRGKLSLGNAIA